jgi:hypothetical protein
MSTSTWRLHVCCFSSVRRQRSEAPWISDLPAYCACTTSCFTSRRSSWCPSSCLEKRNHPCTSLSARSAGITARILSLGTGHGWVLNGLKFRCTSQPFWTLWRRETSLPQPEMEHQSPDRPARSLITILTELLWLQCHSHDVANRTVLMRLALT